MSASTDEEPIKAKALVRLLESWPNTVKGGGSRGEAVADAYLTAVEPDPAWAVEEVCRRIVRGEAEEIDLRYAPTAPQIVKYVKMVTSRYARELADLLKLQEIK